MSRATYLNRPQLLALDHACALLWLAFPESGTYLVGSALKRPDFRDVDVRTIVSDEAFAALFPDGKGARWELLSMALSQWLSRASGLPVDFQIQGLTEANLDDGERNPLGLRWSTQ